MLKVENVSKEYSTPAGPLRIVSDVSLTLPPGSAVSIMGPSGSGKSTLLYMIGALEPPSSGTVTLKGQNPFLLNAKELAAFRNQQIGFVFQDHCLLPQCSVIENVLTPTMVAASANGEPTRRATELLKQVGLAERLDHRPAQLSGGEKQRAALARALIMKPQLLLCDEPTGNLDQKSAEVVANLLLETQNAETILIVVTHSKELAARFPLRFELKNQHLETL